MCASCRSVFSMLCANLPTRSGIGVDLFLVVCLGGGVMSAIMHLLCQCLRFLSSHRIVMFRSLAQTAGPPPPKAPKKQQR